jgi:hypothetical protein
MKSAQQMKNYGNSEAELGNDQKWSKMVKVISAHKEDSSSASPQMTEDDVKNFLTNNNGRLLIHIGLVDEKGEPNIFPTGYYFDRDLDKIYITTQKKSKKVSNLRVKSIV